MTYRDFIILITQNYSSEIEKCIEILKARGFLIEKENSKYILSDNSYLKEDIYNDLLFLSDILSYYNLGKTNGVEIIIENTEKIYELEELFYPNKRWIEEEGPRPYYWREFTKYMYGVKVPVKKLDPFIARYIKAISSCGVNTFNSCDGNDHGLNNILIGCRSSWDTMWHKIIYENFAYCNVDLNWSSDFSTIYLSKNKFETYYKLNQLAEYLYNNRKQIRRIKQDALCGLSSKTQIKKGEDYLVHAFKEKAISIIKNTQEEKYE